MESLLICMYKHQGVEVYNMRASGVFKSEAGEGWCSILYHCPTVTLSVKFTFIQTCSWFTLNKYNSLKERKRPSFSDLSS